MSFLKKVYWTLPHDLRRRAYRYIHPSAYRELNDLRDAVIDQPNSLSFKPFVDNKCIFVHIPKCAGISVCHSLFGCNAGSHKTIKEYSVAFSAEEFNEFFKFTIVRNPWDRLLSAYRFLKQGGRNGFDKQWSEAHLAQYEDFRTFVMEGLDKSEILAWQHFRPQADFITDGSGRIPLDFIGRFESINEDFLTITSNLNKEVSLQVINKTRGEKIAYHKAYDKEMIEKVSLIYQKDIALLKYQF